MLVIFYRSGSDAYVIPNVANVFPFKRHRDPPHR